MPAYVAQEFQVFDLTGRESSDKTAFDWICPVVKRHFNVPVVQDRYHMAPETSIEHKWHQWCQLKLPN
jgi:hypothetical protein